MFFKKAITILAIASQLCSSLKLEPIAKYEGKHSSKCVWAQRLTGTLVNDKIYTVGGCFPVPYMVDPENDLDLFSIEIERQFNTSDAVYSYDIIQDAWTLESHTPLPVNSARLQVVNTDIYMFDIQSHPDYHRSKMWKFATDTKEWQLFDDLPFIWRHMLFTCEHEGIIYFAGNHDGDLRNIIQRYDTHDNAWKSPLFLDKNLLLNKMFCTSSSIQFLGREAHQRNEQGWMTFNYDDPESGVPMNVYELFTSSYEDGKTVENGVNVSLSFSARAVPSGDWVYIMNTIKHNTTLSKLNAFTKEVVELGTVNQTISNPLFVPYKDESIFLIGGQKNDMMYNNHFRNPNEETEELKTYNHKVKLVYNMRNLESEQEQLVIQHNEQ